MVRAHKESRVFTLDRESTAVAQATGHGRAWQLICIDCGKSELVDKPDANDFHAWTCSGCVRRRVIEDKAWIDQQGVRRCHRCKKCLTRMNFGPQCYACDIAHPVGFKPERTLYNDDRIEIMALRAEGYTVGDLADKFKISERTVHEVCRGLIPDEIKDDMLSRFDDGLSYAEVAREFSVSHWTARSVCGPAEGTDFKSRNQAIVDEFEAGGVTYEDLAERYGLAPDRIYRIIAGHVAPRNMPRRGCCTAEGCGGKVLARGLCGKHYMRARKANNERDEKIRAEYVPGIVTHERLAAKYGLAKSTIWAILKKEDT